MGWSSRDYDGWQDVPESAGEQTRAIQMSCAECGFSCTDDYELMKNHSCDVQRQGGRCEDYPCCGHEAGDCNGQKYGSDEKIKADVYRAARDPEFAYMMERQAEYDDYWG